MVNIFLMGKFRENWSTYGMYKYLWYVYVPKVCISTYGMYKYLHYKNWIPEILIIGMIF